MESEIKGMQQELKNLHEALGELVDAMITEAKPDFAEIKRLQMLKKKALGDVESGTPKLVDRSLKPESKSKRRRKKAES